MSGSANTPPRYFGADRNVYAIVLIDIAGSAAHGGWAQRRMRDNLYDLLAEVTNDNGIDFDSLPFDDKGDGLRLIIPLDCIQPTRVVDAFVAGLTAGLREHRRQASEAGRIRLRVCFDIGLVEAHRRSWTGDALVRIARLIDAPQLREALDATPDIDLVAIVSDAMFEIVRHRVSYIAPDCFQEVRVRVKEFDDRAWLLAPRSVGACPYCAYR